MKAVLPTLSDAGFVTNKNMQMSKLFAYFMASEYSQSNAFYGYVSSLKHIIATKESISDIKDGIQEALQKMYRKYYDIVKVIVDEETTDGIRYTLSISIECRDEGSAQRYHLYKEIKTKEGNMIEFENQLDELYQYYGEQL